MNNELFEGENYKIISGLIEKNLPILRKNKDFNQKYLQLTKNIDEIETMLNEKQKEKLHEIIKLFYETEEYYFALAYSLGVKYSKDIEKLQ